VAVATSASIAGHDLAGRPARLGACCGYGGRCRGTIAHKVYARRVHGLHGVVWVAVFAGLSGCAAKRVAQPDPGALGRADAALLQGCYDCLLEAREGYRKLAVADRVFEADLLIALRERELALPASDAIVEATRLASTLPADFEAARYLARVDDVPAWEIGIPPIEAFTFFRVHSDRLQLDAERAWLQRGRLRKPVRDYLRIALDCAYLTGDGALPANDVAPDPRTDPPLLAYRRERCALGTIAAWAALRARVPRFVEASLFTARIEIEIAAREGPGQARAHLDEAAVRFPRSSAVAYLTAQAHAIFGEHAEALRWYERTLTLQPRHSRAMLGRAVSLYHLDRPEDAIVEATRVISQGQPGNWQAFTEAFYWRALAHHRLARLTEARADITTARAESATGDVLGLAGIIEYDQGDLDPAQADLEAAIELSAQDCTSRWYLSRVQHARKHWLASGRAFEAAMTCYRDRARETTDRVAALQTRGDLDVAYRQRQAASLEASIAADTRQQHVAALAAAGDDAIGEDTEAANRLIEIASQDAGLAAQVAKLRLWMAQAKPARAGAHPEPAGSPRLR
jgi:tetratricopeptide (TPR) repeat protein